MKVVSLQAKLLLLTASSAMDNPDKFVRTRNTITQNMPREATGSFNSQSSSGSKQNLSIRVSSQQHVKSSSNSLLPADEIADPALKTTRQNDDAFADTFFDSFELIVITPPASNELGFQMADGNYADNATDVGFDWIHKDSSSSNTFITRSPSFSPTWMPTLPPTAAATRAPSTEQPSTLQPSTINPSLQPKDEPYENPRPYPIIHPSSAPTNNTSLLRPLNPSYSPITKSPSKAPSYSPITGNPTKLPTNLPTSPPSSALPTSTPYRTPSGYAISALPVSAPSRTPSGHPTPAPTSTPSRSASVYPSSASPLSTASRAPSGRPTFALPTSTPPVTFQGHLTSAIPTSAQVQQSSTLSFQSDKFSTSLSSNTKTPAPSAEVGSATVSPSPSPSSFNGVPQALDNTGIPLEDLTSIDLPPMSMTLKTTSNTSGDIDTTQLNSLFSDYLKEYLYLELPNRYQIREIDIVTNSFMDNETKHEYLVTGTLEVVNGNGIDLTQLRKDVSSTLSALFSGQESSSVHAFLEVLQTADYEMIASTSEVTISLLEPVEEPSTVSAVVQNDEVFIMTSRTMYFIIACAGFVGAILLLGYAIYYSISRSKRNARKSRRRQQSAHQELHRVRSRHHSPDSERSHDSYNPAETNNPVVNFLVEACSSMMSGESENKSFRSNEQFTVRTRDVENDCGWLCSPTKPKTTQATNLSVPQRRPYPYPAFDPVTVRSHVQRNTQPTDLTLTMKSTASAREEWTCVDGMVTKKVRSTIWD